MLKIYITHKSLNQSSTAFKKHQESEVHIALPNPSKRECTNILRKGWPSLPIALTISFPHIPPTNT